MTARDDNNATDRLVVAKARQQFESAVDSMDAGTSNRLRLMRREALAGPQPTERGWLVPSIAVAAAVLAIGIAWREPTSPADATPAALAVDEGAQLGFPSDDEAELYAWLGEAPVATPTGDTL
ncbi:MAG: hypothetical protein NT117_08000 [Gammaproteobacteria bacterium]|nr:hypothetical protein [Gammaproteobacteria bacterium]